MEDVKIKSFGYRGYLCRNFLRIRRNRQIMLKFLFSTPMGIDYFAYTQQNVKFDL